MNTEKKICRFCLSTEIEGSSRFLSPCDCKGSMEFIHLKCLNRWRYMDFERNGRSCQLCLTIYTFVKEEELEVIPKKGIYIFFLTFPGPTLMLYHYIYLILLIQPTNFNFQILENFYFVSQYMFHIFYFYIFYIEWTVKNKSLYYKTVKKTVLPFLPLLHLFGFFLLHQRQYFMGPILSFLLGLYWQSHIMILFTVNRQLTNLEE